MMRRIALFSALFCLAVSAADARGQRQVVDVAVDPRFELMSILFRLAGNPEYGRSVVAPYTREVERHFGMMRQHPAVKLAGDLRRRRGLSFDAPMALAAHLSGVAELKLLAPLDPWPAALDSRWQAKDVEAFLDAARAFVKDSAFEAFMRDQKPLHDLASARMVKTLEQAHLEWFDQFFGRRPGARFHLVVGMLNGPGNYGARLVGAEGEELYCVMGVWQCDDQKMPLFPESILPTVVHEFCHSYVNPVVDTHLKALEPAGKELFNRTRVQMQRQAYGNWETVMRESVVRACVVRWRYANQGPVAGMAEVNEQWGRGFLWTAALSKVLSEYEADRKTYPTLTDFMPRVVACFEEHAAH